MVLHYGSEFSKSMSSHFRKSMAMALGTICQCFMMNYLIFPNKVLSSSTRVQSIENMFVLYLVPLNDLFSYVEVDLEIRNSIDGEGLVLGKDYFPNGVFLISVVYRLIDPRSMDTEPFHIPPSMAPRSFFFFSCSFFEFFSCF